MEINTTSKEKYEIWREILEEAKRREPQSDELTLKEFMEMSGMVKKQALRFLNEQIVNNKIERRKIGGTNYYRKIT